MSVRPGYVSTPMTNHRKLSFGTITTEESVAGALRNLGHEVYTNGNFNHFLIGYALSKIPDTIIQPYFLKLKKASRQREGKS